MTTCPNCSKEFEGTDTCPQCGTKVHLQKPARPTGMTIVAILIFLGAIMSIWAMFQDQPAICLGFFLPTIFATAFNALVALIALYCGIGIWQQKALARKVYMYFAAFGIANALSSIFRLDSLVAMAVEQASKKAVAGAPMPAESVFYISIMVGITIGIVVNGILLYYVWKKKDVFVN